MDKIHRRAQQVSRKIIRRKGRDRKHWLKSNEVEQRYKVQQYKTAQNNLKKAAKIRRREDWELGPLAPRRDVGAGGKDLWGTAPDSQVLGMGLVLPKSQWKWVPFASGDRVVIIKGHDQGKIGTVGEVSREGQYVTVTGLHRYEVFTPEWMKKVEGDQNPSKPYVAIIPVSNVRLVIPLVDKETREVKDTIIDQIEMRNRGERFIPGLNILVPRPRISGSTPKDYDDDTLRITVDEETFTPTLASPPMPGSVLDELRNKYSKLRTRHEAEYVQKIEQRARAEQLRSDSVKDMETPLKELQKKLSEDAASERSESARRERGELVGDDLLARLGELMLDNKSVTEQGTPPKTQYQSNTSKAAPQMPLQSPPGPGRDAPIPP